LVNDLLLIARLPKKMIEIAQKTASMITKDGVRLDADIYRPNTKEDLPILLMRQPYGKAIASTVVYAHPIWYAAQGYIVVIQDVRGRGTSQGEFKLFENEIADGIETIDWVSQLPGSTGNIGMYGFSYQGMTQLYAAMGKSTHLKAIAPAAIGYDLYSDWAYENGAFCLQANLGWAIQLAAETKRRKGDEIAYQKLYRASRNLPLNDSIPAFPEILQLEADSFYHDWLSQPQNSAYWQKLSPKYLLQDIDLPMLHIGGWFDPYLRGTLNLYHAMSQKSQHPQHLIIAPWAHFPWGRKLGAVDYGKEAQNYIGEIQIRWFDYFLKGKDTGILAEAPISLFEMGSDRWLYWEDLAQFDRQNITYYLASDGLAATKEESGMLWQEQTENLHSISEKNLNLEEAAADYLDTDEFAEFPNTRDIIVHDPWRSVTALGGHASFPGGSFDRSHLDCRSDILTYTSAPLEIDLNITGIVTLEIYCQADKPSFDLGAILSEVYSDGRVFNFTQGYIKVDFLTNPVIISLQATCIQITAGNSLRLSLSGAYFPAYPINSGTTKSLLESRLIDRQIITISVFSGADYPSLIKLYNQK
jgi:uncharacterized protein